MGREPDDRTFAAIRLYCDLVTLGRLSRQTGIDAMTLAELPERMVSDLCQVADAYERRQRERDEAEIRKQSR